MNNLTTQLLAMRDLTLVEIEESVRCLASAEITADDKAAFLRALRAKGETASEISGFVEALLALAVDPEIDPASLDGPLLDVCGTGGDRLELFNVSTTSMFVLAGGGVFVAKHGNRAITSQAGGADVLEALGVRIDLSPGEARECLRATGVAFLFAPNYHPAFKEIAPVRKRLAAEGTPTIFNILGPLLNPARPAHQLVGVFSEAVLPRYAEALAALARESAWVVCGASPSGFGMDEVSTLGPTLVRQVKGKGITEFTIVPEYYEMVRASVEELRGGDRVQNAAIVEGVLDGSIAGAKRDIVLLNAAAGFVVTGIARDLSEGIALAREQIDSGRALDRLRRLQRWSSN
jgi:anthranilate phosphoribosyltransferase